MLSVLLTVTNQRLHLKYIFEIFPIKIHHANIRNDLCIYDAYLG